jgi:hypothetical protein
MKTLETAQVVGNPAQLTNTRQGPRVIDIPELPRTLEWPWGGYQDTSESNDNASIRHSLLKLALRRLDHEYVPRNRQVVAFHEQHLESGATRITHLCREDQNLHPEIASPVRLLPDHDPRVVEWSEDRQNWRTDGAVETDASAVLLARNGWLYCAVCRMNEAGIPVAQQRIAFRERPGRSPGCVCVSCMYWSEPI